MTKELTFEQAQEKLRKAIEREKAERELERMRNERPDYRPEEDGPDWNGRWYDTSKE
jgi:uncharacterized protein (DUF3084 family)